MKLVVPALQYLDSYQAALEEGWGPNNFRVAESGREELAMIATDEQAFLASLVNLEPVDQTITLPGGQLVPRLPGYRKWLWDGEFCGSIGFRWQNGTEALPAWCLGHIGYSVVPWKQRLGYGTAALRQLLPEARARGMRYVELTTEPDNPGSRAIITANGGELIEAFDLQAHYGSGPMLRYRIFFEDRK